MKSLSLTLTALASAVLVGAPVMAHAQCDPAPQPEIKPVLHTYNGSGCAPSDVKTTFDASGHTAAITLSDGGMIAGAGEPVSRREFRKNCQYGLDAGVPEGYTYAIKKLTQSGSAYIEEGATGYVGFSQYFQGMSSTKKVSYPIKGLFEDSFSFDTTVDTANLVWAPCGSKRLLQVNTEFKVNRGSQTSDSYSWIRGDEDQGVKIEFALKKC